MKLYSVVIIISILSLRTSVASSFVASASSLKIRSNLFGTLEDEADFQEKKICISKPEIHWTVPGFKIGWRDDDGNWFDEDGPRDGPPLNYWRQSADERVYNQAMDVVDAILTDCEDVNLKISKLERKNSARRPSTSRKILGEWVPLLVRSKRVAHKSFSQNDKIGVSFILSIYRSNGRRFGQRNNYGLFDKIIENGEELTMSTSGSINTSTKIIASELNEQIELASIDEKIKLYFGGITYIEDYIMIQRSPDGLIDFFLRADESYLGVSDEEVAKYSHSTELNFSSARI